MALTAKGSDIIYVYIYTFIFIYTYLHIYIYLFTIRIEAVHVPGCCLTRFPFQEYIPEFCDHLIILGLQACLTPGYLYHNLIQLI